LRVDERGFAVRFVVSGRDFAMHQAATGLSVAWRPAPCRSCGGPSPTASLLVSGPARYNDRGHLAIGAADSLADFGGVERAR
jgi:hypothetical protein